MIGPKYDFEILFYLDCKANFIPKIAPSPPKKSLILWKFEESGQYDQATSLKATGSNSVFACSMAAILSAGTGGEIK